MHGEQKKWIIDHFRSVELPPIKVLDVPDTYEYMDPRLQKALRQAVDPELNALSA
jgi:predicted protein tyrosine phosphatase